MFKTREKTNQLMICSEGYKTKSSSIKNPLNCVKEPPEVDPPYKYTSTVFPLLRDKVAINGNSSLT